MIFIHFSYFSVSIRYSSQTVRTINKGYSAGFMIILLLFLLVTHVYITCIESGALYVAQENQTPYSGNRGINIFVSSYTVTECKITVVQTYCSKRAPVSPQIYIKVVTSLRS